MLDRVLLIRAPLILRLIDKVSINAVKEVLLIEQSELLIFGEQLVVLLQCCIVFRADLGTQAVSVGGQLVSHP